MGAEEADEVAGLEFKPVPRVCPSCQNKITTDVNFYNGILAIVAGASICAVGYDIHTMRSGMIFICAVGYDTYLRSQIRNSYCTVGYDVNFPSCIQSSYYTA